MSRRGAAWALAAPPVLAGGGVASSPGRPRAAAAPSPARDRFAAAKGAWRPIEGRLCISGSSAGPVDAASRPADALAFAAAAAEIAAAGADDAGAVHDLALLRIFEARLEDAARLFLQAAALPHVPACAWADLAAVRLGLFERRDDPRELVLALDAALRAGNEPAARFNRVLVKDRLFLPSAHEEWERVLRGEEDAAWQEEIRRRGAAAAPIDVPVGPSLAHALLRRGLLRCERGRFADALQDYTAAAPLLEAAGEWDGAAHAHSLAGAVLRHVGQRRLAWGERLKAFRALRALGRPSRHVRVLGDAAQAADEERLPYAAAALAGEFVLAARPSGDAALIGTAQRLRASALQGLGRTADARRALASARDAVRGTSDAALRRRLEADIDLDVARMELETGRPAEALRLLARVQRAHEKGGLEWVLARAGQLRGRALLVMGRRAEARVALEDALRRIEDQEDIAELLLLEAASTGRARAALAHAEQALDIRHRGSPAQAEAAVAALEDRLDSRTAVVEMTLVHDRALAWVTTHRGTSQVVLPATPARVGADLAALEDGIGRHESPHLLLPLLARLHALLLDPLEKHLYGVRRLLIVPHGTLGRVPWPALTDAQGRAAISRWTLSLAPSALSLSEHEPALAPPAAHDDVLVVANAAFDATGLPWLRGRAGAEEEATRLAALYPKATVLTGPAATVPRVVEALGQARVVHYAGPVITNAETGETTLPLAPTVSATGETVGFLYGSELRGLPLGRLDLVVLAASRGSSLARSFLHAGAGAVVGALWDAGDAASGAVITALHQALRQQRDPACALAEVQRHCASRAAADVSPLAWGAFQVLSRRLPAPCRPEEGAA